jgi:xanthosine utilization system XapX-like protein
MAGWSTGRLQPVRTILYAPFAIVGSIVARLVGRQIFRAVWSRIDEEPPPKAGDGRGSMTKVVAGRALQAGLMAGAAAAVDRLFARGFHHVLGAWPKKPPKQKD